MHHVTHMTSCQTYECVTTHVGMSHVTYEYTHPANLNTCLQKRMGPPLTLSRSLSVSHTYTHTGARTSNQSQPIPRQDRQHSPQPPMLPYTPTLQSVHHHHTTAANNVRALL